MCHSVYLSYTVAGCLIGNINGNQLCDLKRRTVMKECEECYSINNRSTPILNPRDCLENHLQYICGTCGRCICVNRTEKSGLQRWNFPFKTLETAKLYLRSADICAETNCGIYEIKNERGRYSYKIFNSPSIAAAYTNNHKVCLNEKPLYQRERFKRYPNAEIRRLTSHEVDIYLKEQNETK